MVYLLSLAGLNVIVGIMWPFAWVVTKIKVGINKTSIGRKRALKRAFAIEGDIGVEMDVIKTPKFGWVEVSK